MYKCKSCNEVMNHVDEVMFFDASGWQLFTQDAMDTGYDHCKCIECGHEEFKAFEQALAQDMGDKKKSIRNPILVCFECGKGEDVVTFERELKMNLGHRELVDFCDDCLNGVTTKNEESADMKKLTGIVYSGSGVINHDEGTYTFPNEVRDHCISCHPEIYPGGFETEGEVMDTLCPTHLYLYIYGRPNEDIVSIDTLTFTIPTTFPTGTDTDGDNINWGIHPVNHDIDCECQDCDGFRAEITDEVPCECHDTESKFFQDHGCCQYCHFM